MLISAADNRRNVAIHKCIACLVNRGFVVVLIPYITNSPIAAVQYTASIIVDGKSLIFFKTFTFLSSASVFIFIYNLFFGE